MDLVGFQPPGDSEVCTSFGIIDDLMALEEDDKFVIHVDTAQDPTIVLRSPLKIMMVGNWYLVLYCGARNYSLIQNDTICFGIIFPHAFGTIIIYILLYMYIV